MPIYEYRCRECQHRFEKLVPVGTADSGMECPACHQKRVQKVLSVFGTKGSTARPAASSGCSTPHTHGGG